MHNCRQRDCEVEQMSTTLERTIMTRTHTPDRVDQALLDAAKALEEKGWVQNYTNAVDGRMCARGAILYVTEGFMPLPYEAEARLDAYLSVYKNYHSGIVAWNDTPG